MPTAKLAPLLVLFALCPDSEAQGDLQVAQLQGTVKNAGTYRLATGDWQRRPSVFGIQNQGALYRNDFFAAYAGLLDESEVLFDEGRLPGAGHPLQVGGGTFGTSDAYVITGFTLGYCAFLPDRPVELRLDVFEAYLPCSNPAALRAQASLVTSGLPSGGCWVISVDLTGTSLVFDLAAEGGDGSWDNSNALDDFGFSINVDANQGDGGGSFTAGVLLAGWPGNPATVGDGTIFQNPSNAGTGLGSEDLFWLISPIVADGCYFYGGCPMCGTIASAFYGEPATFSQPVCSPAAPNSISAGGAILESTVGFGSGQAGFTLRDVPDQPGVLFGGTAFTQLPFGCGERCVGGMGLRYGLIRPQGNTASATVDMTVLGPGSGVQYWYRDPDFAPSCGAGFNLSNGLF